MCQHPGGIYLHPVGSCCRGSCWNQGARADHPVGHLLAYFRATLGCETGANASRRAAIHILFLLWIRNTVERTRIQRITLVRVWANVLSPLIKLNKHTVPVVTWRASASYTLLPARTEESQEREQPADNLSCCYQRLDQMVAESREENILTLRPTYALLFLSPIFMEKSGKSVVEHRADGVHKIRSH